MIRFEIDRGLRQPEAKVEKTFGRFFKKFNRKTFQSLKKANCIQQPAKWNNSDGKKKSITSICLVWKVSEAMKSVFQAWL